MCMAGGRSVVFPVVGESRKRRRGISAQAPGPGGGKRRPGRRPGSNRVAEAEPPGGNGKMKGKLPEKVRLKTFRGARNER